MPWINKTKDEINAYKREWYQNNKKKVIGEVRNRRLDIRERFNEFKTTLKCETCGENHISCLDFHHLDPNEKDFDVAKMVHEGWGWEKIMSEISKCIVLCANCHRKVHYDIKNEQ